jgi:cytochrome c peroxidase
MQRLESIIPPGGAAALLGRCGVAVFVVMAATLSANRPAAQESSTVLSPHALQEIAQVEAEIDRIEAQTMERLATPPDNQVQQIELIGKLLLYDKQLSVNRNEACVSATCQRWALPARCLN